MKRYTENQDRHMRRLEQLASLSTSIIWTAIVLVVLVIVWGYQDAQAQWQFLADEARSQALHESVAGLSGGPEDTATSGPVTYLNTELTPWSMGDGAPQVLPETPLDQLTAAPLPPAPASSTPSPTITPRPTSTPGAETVVTPITRNAQEASIPNLPTQRPTPTLPPTPTLTPEPTPSTDVSVTDGIPDRLVIKSVGIDSPVAPVRWTTVTQGDQEYSMWEVADYAAGWHITSALPGQPGNTVLAGHHNIKGEIFRYLVDIQEGDEIDVYAGDTIYRYSVEQKLIVKEKDEPIEVRQRNAQWIAPTNDVRLTLVTCWPYTNNTHRVIVVGKPIP